MPIETQAETHDPSPLQWLAFEKPIGLVADSDQDSRSAAERCEQVPAFQPDPSAEYLRAGPCGPAPEKHGGLMPQLDAGTQRETTMQVDPVITDTDPAE